MSIARRLTRSSLLLALGCVVGCADPTSPTFPVDAERIAPLLPYRTWWHLVEACSGLRGDFAAVAWFATNGLGDVMVGGKPYLGYYFKQGNRIVLSGSSIFDGGTVRHEILHALLQSGQHPREYFVDRCEALTPCDRECGLEETTRGVPASAPELLPTALQVTAHLDPGTPTISVDSGWFRITITATNPRLYPIWVRLSDDVAFLYVEEHRSGTAALTGAPRWAFLAGESRRYIFDEQYPVGSYTLYTSFARQHAAPLLFSVVP